MLPLEKQTILITGATDGLGRQVAQDLAARGAKILLHGRNPDKGKAVCKEIRDATGNDGLKYYNADFASLDEVKQLANQIKEEAEPLHILVNNAGIGFGDSGEERAESADGYELRFQVNYLGGFLLSTQLLSRLRSSKEARIINVASAGQQPIDFEDVMLQNNYSGKRAYNQSKLAQIMFTFEFARRLNSKEITVNALHPATLMDTKLVRDAAINPINTIEKGAEAVEHLATAPKLSDVTGKYFNGKQPARAIDQAYDQQARSRLWELSKDLTESEVEKQLR
jgi:NAD(P)-dependent dehydrogenase (short-subunit alcohol dehydrogenase family)